MQKFARYALALLVVASLSLTVATGAFATTSTVNPNVPAQNSPLSSATIRNGISLPAYTDITTLFGDFTVSANQILGSLAGGQAGPLTVPLCSGSTSALGLTSTGFTCNSISTSGGISALTGDVTASGTGSVAATLVNNPTARTDIGLGTASTPSFAGLLLSGVGKVNLNAVSLPTAQTGTVLQKGNADATITRDEIDSFGAAGHFTTVRWDGTNASPTALLSGDALGSFNSFGYNGTAVVGPQAAIRCFANQNWAVGSNGTYCDIATTPNGSTTMTQVIQFNNDGGVTSPGVTGGDIGAGTINFAGLYVSGASVVLPNVATTYTAGQRVTPVSITISTSTFTPNLNLGNDFNVTLIHASCPCTLANPTNMAAGQSGQIIVNQSSTGSDLISTYGSFYKFPSGSAPTLSAGANAVDILSYYVIDSTHIALAASTNFH